MSNQSSDLSSDNSTNEYINVEESKDDKQTHNQQAEPINRNSKRPAKEETSMNIKKMRFLNQDESSRSKASHLHDETTNEEPTTPPIKSASAPDFADAKQGRYSAIDILARLFPNQKRNVMELVLQGCNGDALKTIDYFLSLSDNLALNGIKSVNASSGKSASLSKSTSQSNPQQQPNSKATSKKLPSQPANPPGKVSDAKRASYVELPNHSVQSSTMPAAGSMPNSSTKRLTGSAFSPLVKRNLAKDHLNSSPIHSLYSSHADQLSKTSSSLINPLQFSIDSANLVLPPMSNYLTGTGGLANYPLTKIGQPINTGLNPHFLLNNNGLPKTNGLASNGLAGNLPNLNSLSSGGLQTSLTNSINPLLNTIRVSPNSSSLCSTPLSDGQQCNAGTNCSSCSTSNAASANLLGAPSNARPPPSTADALSSVQIYSQPLNPFSSSLIDFTFNSSPQTAAIASLLLSKNGYNRFYRNSDLLDLSNAAQCDQQIDTQLQLRFKAIHSSSSK